MWPVKYRQFVEKHALIGVECQIPEEDDLSEMGGTIRLYHEDEAKKESEEFYPGLIVLSDGFVAIGEDSTGSGDPYFINVNDKQPGPIYRIYHESVADSDYDRDEAIQMVLKSYRKLLDFVEP